MKKGIGERGIRILEAMIDNHMIAFETKSIDDQYDKILKWNDEALSAAERILKIPTPQKMKVGESKSDEQMIGSHKIYENGAVLSDKDREWAIGVADKFEANPELYDPRWFNKRKIGS